MRAGLTAALAVLNAAMLAGPAAAQDANVADYLDNGAAAHTANGHRAMGRQSLATLSMDDAQLWPVEVRAGQTYVFYGACDDSCSDLDMDLYDANGRKVDTDIAPDDTPFVQFTAERSGWAHVRYWLAACRAETCAAGVRAMSGGRLVERAQPGEGEVAGDWPAHVLGILDTSGQRHIEARFGAIQRASQDEIVPVTLESEGHTFTFQLNGGMTYRFQAACDQDCTDVDIEALDPSGTQVASNTDFDNNPYIEVRPETSGPYGVRVWLAQCSVEPCFVGVRGYERR